MLIDFEKAFDSISRKFLYGALKLLGFGPKMMKWITVFNTNITGYVLQCGFLSQPFPINRGREIIFQGPLDPFIKSSDYRYC